MGCGARCKCPCLHTIVRFKWLLKVHPCPGQAPVGHATSLLDFWLRLPRIGPSVLLVSPAGHSCWLHWLFGFWLQGVVTCAMMGARCESAMLHSSPGRSCFAGIPVVVGASCCQLWITFVSGVVIRVAWRPPQTMFACLLIIVLLVFAIEGRD